MITVSGQGDETQVSLTGLDEAYYEVSHESADMAATIKIKNRPAAFQIKKIDAQAQTSLEGVHFALYRQVKDIRGNLVKDYQPVKGYADMITDENGILTEITMDLEAGTYYLTETRAAEGYELLAEDLIFTRGEDGTISIVSDAYKSWLKAESDPATGNVAYLITIPNSKMKNVLIRKVSAGTDTVLSGAAFELYAADDFNDNTGKPINGAEPLISGETDEEGMLALGSIANGQYRLIETKAPDGHVLFDKPIKIFVNNAAVTALQGIGNAPVAQTEDGSWQITIWNTAGQELPATGGPGTGIFHMCGSLILMLAGIIFLLGKRKTIY